MLSVVVTLLLAIPPIPPLPPASWPAAEIAEPFARELMRREPPGDLARELAANPELMPKILRNLGTAMMSSDAGLRESLPAYVATVLKAPSERETQSGWRRSRSSILSDTSMTTRFENAWTRVSRRSCRESRRKLHAGFSTS